VLDQPPRHLRVAGPEAAVADQINTLLGDVDAPGRWHTRSLSLLTTGDATKGGAATGLQLAHQYLNHFCCLSDYKELLSRTALPVEVRQGMVAAMGNRQAGLVVLGPNT
jgi:hypothetical protein